MPDPAAMLWRRGGPPALPGLALAGRSSPTADLYFANACRDWIDSGRVEARAATVFGAPGVELVIRHDGRAAPRLDRPRLVYLMDDVWRTGAQGPGLSRRYRLKLRLLDAPAARWHLARARDVVLSSDALLAPAARDAPQATLHRLDPYWSEPLADLAHFESSGRDLVFLGGHSHQADLDPLAPMLRDLLDTRPGLSLTLSGEIVPPPALAGHPGVARIPVTGWADYRALLPRRRFHLALYPLAETPFNAARSVNKLIEHAVVGAPGLYAAHWPPGAAADAAGAGLALGDGPQVWGEAIRALLDAPDRLEAMAAAARRHAAALNRAEPQRALWSRLLLGGAG